MSAAREPSYYEIALTHRQVVFAFVVLLGCILVAFLAGVWVGQGAERPEPVREEARTPAPEEPAEPPAGVSGELRFFSDSEAGASEPADRRQRPAPTRRDAATGDGGAADGPARRAEETARRSPETTPPAGSPRAGSQRPEPERPTGSLPSQPAPTRATAPPGEGYVVQVFSSHDQSQAQEVLERLLRSDQEAYLSPSEVDGRVMYRVRLGPFRSRDEAEAVASRVRRDLKLDTWITR